MSPPPETSSPPSAPQQTQIIDLTDVDENDPALSAPNTPESSAPNPNNTPTLAHSDLLDGIVSAAAAQQTPPSPHPNLPNGLSSATPYQHTPSPSLPPNPPNSSPITPTLQQEPIFTCSNLSKTPTASPSPAQRAFQLQMAQQAQQKGFFSGLPMPQDPQFPHPTSQANHQPTATWPPAPQMQQGYSLGGLPQPQTQYHPQPGPTAINRPTAAQPPAQQNRQSYQSYSIGGLPSPQPQHNPPSTSTPIYQQTSTGPALPSQSQQIYQSHQRNTPGASPTPQPQIRGKAPTFPKGLISRVLTYCAFAWTHEVVAEQLRGSGFPDVNASTVGYIWDVYHHGSVMTRAGAVPMPRAQGAGRGVP